MASGKTEPQVVHWLFRIGTYAVTVTDNNQCKGSDTVTITTIRLSPQNFLPADTLICTYGKLKLIPTSSFKSYTWSTNEQSAAISTSKPGTYWLQASNQFGCVGHDSITIKPKDCLFGFYIPNAFTLTTMERMMFSNQCYSATF